MTQVEFAKVIDVPLQRVNEIIKGQRGVSVD
jgi:plasmid maintenance system antidote protein VapI